MFLIELIKILIYTIIVSVVFAFLEIQIEGKNGWAAKLPCWRIKTGFLTKIIGDRPLTGYFVGIIMSVLILLHFPFLFTFWSLQKELVILAVFLILTVLEDFFWFVFNPYYGIKKFKEGKIWWHKNWIGPVPSYYVSNLVIAAIFLYFGMPGL